MVAVEGRTRTHKVASPSVVAATRNLQLTLRDFLSHFITFREEVITRRTKFELNKARDRAHILLGLVIAVTNLDEVVRIIRGSPNPATARETLLAREWPMGDPLNPVNRVGALVSKAHFDKVSGYLGKGPKVLLGGKAEAGFVEPTILDCKRGDLQVREEIFGPILTVLTVDNYDEAIALANDTEYGLAASIFTANVKKAIRGARAIRAGTVTVNSFGEGDISTPFGGFKQSGFGGRDNGIHAHDQYTQIKTIWIDLADDLDEAVA